MSRGVWTRTLPLNEREIQFPGPALVGVISDTHVSATTRRRSLAPVFDFFQRAGVGLILHAGDVGHPSVLENLGEIAPVEAVRGNADPRDLIETLPDRVRIAVGSRSVLLLHGHHGKTALKMARAAASPEIDLIIFGHSHKPLIGREGSTILFNPGSPTERRWTPHFGIGLIKISSEAIEPELILFDEPSHLVNVAP